MGYSNAPVGNIGSGVAEYSRSRLSAEQEESFPQLSMSGYIENGWLVDHDTDKHGASDCVLPLMAVLQEHKQSTPVRPVLDYRRLNEHMVCHPGADSPVCEEKLRTWRKAGEAGSYNIIDIKKAYLQVRIAPDLLRFQVLSWRGKTYVMTRMGFGLSVAPKLMNIIVHYVTRAKPDIDNYVDDVLVPKKQTTHVEEEPLKYGPPTKPAERLPTTRVLGLQLQESGTGEVNWSRREPSDLEIPVPFTIKAIVVSVVRARDWPLPRCLMAESAL